MVGYWSNMSSYSMMSTMVVALTCYWLLLMGYTWSMSFDFFPILQMPSKWVSYYLPYFTLNHDSVTLTRVVIFDSFNELVSTIWVSQYVYNVKKHIPKDPQVIIFQFDWVLRVVTFQLPLEFHPNLSYIKLNVLTWDQGGSPIICLMRLCFKPQLNLIRQSKVIHLPMKVAEMGY